MEPSQQLIVSDIQLPISPEYDESQVSCCVPAYERDADNVVCAVGIPLIVLCKFYFFLVVLLGH